MFPLYDTNPHRRVPYFTLLIIAINVIVQFWVWRQPPPKQVDILAHYGFIPARINQLSDPKLIVKWEIPPPDNPPGAKPRVIALPADSTQIYLSLLTTMFLHAGWFHLIMNIWILWIFGNNIEDRLGHFIFVCFYLLGGLLATFGHWLFDMNGTMPVVGASGAIAAVLGAYAITFPTAKVRTLIFVFLVDLPAMIFLGLWFILQLVPAVLQFGKPVQAGVAFWAHIGGFIAGMVLMPILAMGAPPPLENWDEEAEKQFGPLKEP